MTNVEKARKLFIIEVKQVITWTNDYNMQFLVCTFQKTFTKQNINMFVLQFIFKLGLSD